MYPKLTEHGCVRWQTSDNIFVEKQWPTLDVGPHCHDYIEIAFVCRGQLVQNIEGKNCYMGRGSMLLVDYEQIHSFHVTPGTEHYNVFIKLDLFDDGAEEKRGFSSVFDIPVFSQFKNKADIKQNLIFFSNEECGEVELLLEMMERECKGKPLGYYESLKASAIILMNMILRKMTEEKADLDEDIAKRLIDFIYKNYSEKLTLEQTALRYNYNPSYFGRLFKRYTGYSFREYLKRVRVEKAAELLREKEINIDEICIKVGYNNKTKFFEHFKSIMGVTPYKYRKNKEADMVKVDRKVEDIGKNKKV